MKDNSQKGEYGHLLDAWHWDDAQPCCGFLDIDHVPPRNYTFAVVLKDLGYSSILRDKIPMKRTPPKFNGEAKSAFYYKTPQITCFSHITQTQLFENYTK